MLTPQGVEQLRLRLYLDRIVLVGVKQHMALTICVYAIPSSLLSTQPYLGDSRPLGACVTQPPVNVDDIDALVLNCTDIQFPTGFDFHLSTESAEETSTIMPIIVFPSLVVLTGGLGYTINFPLSSLNHKTDFGQLGESHPICTKIQMQQFATPAKTSTDIICIGKTGLRAVWMQRRWDNDEFDFIKATFPSSGEPASVMSLLPKYTPLPFEPHACQSLAFDEAGGHLYISLHTGELYLLDL
jgi:hypothetical protein